MSRTPRFSIPFDDIQSSVLGNDYELSLVFVDSRESKRLNKAFRGKNKPTNVLSFPLSDTSGEIFIDLEVAKDECASFDMSYKNFVAYLFIHGILHLSGLDHGATMERKERALLAQFKFDGTPHSSRNRRRNITS